MDEEKRAEQADIEAVLRLLDRFAESGESRMKLDVSGGQAEGSITKTYHHGRCDVGSPWAKGDCYDAPEAECDLSQE